MSTSMVFAVISGLLVLFLFMMLNLMKTWIGKLEDRIKTLEEKQK
ncbi:hypothetical protein N9N00_03100 [Schleiferiaceae bacterium]|nr:hypothetical protein [Schleiferiaceae bacterium]